MKKIIMFSAAILIVSIVATLSLAPSFAQKQKKAKLPCTPIPENVMKILKNSCSACHGNGGNGLAMGIWNLNSWDTYKASKQAKKSNAMCKAVTNGSMPPKSYTTSKPDAVVKTTQITEICTWASSLQIKKE